MTGQLTAPPLDNSRLLFLFFSWTNVIHERKTDSSLDRHSKASRDAAAARFREGKKKIKSLTISKVHLSILNDARKREWEKKKKTDGAEWTQTVSSASADFRFFFFIFSVIIKEEEESRHFWYFFLRFLSAVKRGLRYLHQGKEKKDDRKTVRRRRRRPIYFLVGGFCLVWILLPVMSSVSHFSCSSHRIRFPIRPSRLIAFAQKGRTSGRPSFCEKWKSRITVLDSSDREQPLSLIS